MNNAKPKRLYLTELQCDCGEIGKQCFLKYLVPNKAIYLATSENEIDFCYHLANILPKLKVWLMTSPFSKKQDILIPETGKLLNLFCFVKPHLSPIKKFCFKVTRVALYIVEELQKLKKIRFKLENIFC